VAAIKVDFDQLVTFPLSGVSREHLAADLRVKFHGAYGIYYTPASRELIIVRAARRARRGGHRRSRRLQRVSEDFDRNQLVPITEPMALPAIITAAGKDATTRFLEFFAANIRDAHTRRAYSRSVADFLARCETAGVPSMTAVQPLHVGAYVEGLTRTHSAPTAKQHLAAIRNLFDWLRNTST